LRLKHNRFLNSTIGWILIGSISCSAASIGDVIGSIQVTISNGAQPEVVLAVALTALFLVGLLVLNEIRKADARERARAKISWEAFYAKTKDIGLTSVEIKMLEAMVMESRLSNADALLTSAQVFENSREAYYDSRGGVSGMTDVSLRSFRAIRGRLGFSPLPVETPFTTTRQFTAGLRVVIEVPSLNVASSAQVEEVDERTWIVANPFEAKQGLKEGLVVRLALTRGGDAEYGIETEIDKVNERSLVLRHTRRLTRRQLRNWVRVDVSLPAMANVMPKEGDTYPPLPIKGRVVDLSGGGLALRLPVQLQVGARLTVEFQLNETLIRDVEVEIIRVSPVRNADEPMFQHSVSFKELPKTTQERIVRFVFERQRQDAQWR